MELTIKEIVDKKRKANNSSRYGNVIYQNGLGCQRVAKKYVEIQDKPFLACLFMMRQLVLLP